MIVFGVGAFVHFSGPPRSLGWLLVVLFAAWIGQQVGGRLVSDTLGAFFGGAGRHPGRRLGRDAPFRDRRRWPRSCPRSGCSYPGAVGLIGMAEFVGSNRAGRPRPLRQLRITFISIGIGVLVGNALVLRWETYRQAARVNPQRVTLVAQRQQSSWQAS